MGFLFWKQSQCASSSLRSPQRGDLRSHVRPCLPFHFLYGDKDGPNFHSLEIDRYWDRLHSADRNCRETALGADGIRSLENGSHQRERGLALAAGAGAQPVSRGSSCPH